MNHLQFLFSNLLAINANAAIFYLLMAISAVILIHMLYDSWRKRREIVIKINTVGDVKEHLKAFKEAQSQSLALAQSLAQSLARDLDQAQSLARDLDLAQSQSLALALALAQSLARDLDQAQSQSLARDLDLALALDQAQSLARALDQAQSQSLALDQANAKVNKLKLIAYAVHSKLDNTMRILFSVTVLIGGSVLLSLFSYGQLIQWFSLACHVYLSIGWNLVWQANYLWLFPGQYFAFCGITLGLVLIACIFKDYFISKYFDAKRSRSTFKSFFFYFCYALNVLLISGIIIIFISTFPVMTLSLLSLVFSIIAIGMTIMDTRKGGAKGFFSSLLKGSLLVAIPVLPLIYGQWLINHYVFIVLSSLISLPIVGGIIYSGIRMPSMRAEAIAVDLLGTSIFDKSNHNTECNVCLEEFQGRDQVKKICDVDKHAVHEGCANQWIEIRKKQGYPVICSMCRQGPDKQGPKEGFSLKIHKAGSEMFKPCDHIYIIEQLESFNSKNQSGNQLNT
jgi:hypothetical protein